MPESTQQWPVPGVTYTAGYPTPDQKDYFLYVYLDSKIPGFVLPLYGTAHADTVKYPAHKVGLVMPDKDQGNGWWIVVYVKDREPEDADNWDVDYPYGNNSFPRITRTYILPRATYMAGGPLALGTADPGLLIDGTTPQFAGAVHVSGDKEQQGTGDPVMDSLYVKVQRQFEVLPGLIQNSEQEDGETLSPVIIGTQLVTTPSLPLSKVRGTFTANATTNIFTMTNHRLVNGMAVQVSNSGGGLPSGLAASTNYWVIAATANTFQLSATAGGSAIDITTNGTGTQSLLLIDGTAWTYKPINDYMGTMITMTLLNWSLLSITEKVNFPVHSPALIVGIPFVASYEGPEGDARFAINFDRRSARTQILPGTTTMTYGPSTIAADAVNTYFYPNTKDITYDGILFNISEHGVLCDDWTITANTASTNKKWGFVSEAYPRGTIPSTATSPTATAYLAQSLTGLIAASITRPWKYHLYRKENTALN